MIIMFVNQQIQASAKLPHEYGLLKRINKLSELLANQTRALEMEARSTVPQSASSDEASNDNIKVNSRRSFKGKNTKVYINKLKDAF